MALIQDACSIVKGVVYRLIACEAKWRVRNDFFVLYVQRQQLWYQSYRRVYEATPLNAKMVIYKGIKCKAEQAGKVENGNIERTSNQGPSDLARGRQRALLQSECAIVALPSE